MERPTTEAGSAAGSDRPAGGHPAFLPSDVDPTVFDEDFLRRLERLAVLVKRPVRGGLKGGRRSVKRGQSVEFADYRDYTLGDDLRQLDWNVYARLEKLLVKLFIEEEDLTVALLVDGSASMAHGDAGQARLRQARGRGPGVHRPRGRGPGRAGVAGRAISAAAGRPARLRARVPPAGRAVRHRAGGRRRPTSWRPAGTRWPR